MRLTKADTELSTDDAKNYIKAKSYKGVEIHGHRVRLSFPYNGSRKREVLAVPRTPRGIDSAFQKLQRCLTDIELNQFDYEKEFPRSKEGRTQRVKRLSKMITVEAGIERWWAEEVPRFSKSGVSTIRSRIDKYIKPKWGKVDAAKITTGQLSTWIRDLMDGDYSSVAKDYEQGLARSTVSAIISYLRGMYKILINDDLTQITTNPCDGVIYPKEAVNSNKVKIDAQGRVVRNDVDPFTFEELAAIEQAPTNRIIEKHMWLFNCYAGMRISELMGLGLQDIDFENKTAIVRRAHIGMFGPTKTGKERTIDLNDVALKHLRIALEARGEIEPMEIEVKEFKKNSFYTMTHYPILINSNTRRIFTSGADSYAKQFFKRFIEGIEYEKNGAKFKIRYRGPNNARHTFASTMITANIPYFWVMSQTGHEKIETFETHYATFIKENDRAMVSKVSNIFNEGVANAF